jgi:hypothetical protein
MGLVFAGLFTAAVVLVALWLYSLIGSARLDRIAAIRKAQDQAKQAEQAAREARLYNAGEPLRCMGCGATFLGPLPDIGCPNCHMAALVVTEADYQDQQRKASQGVGGELPPRGE